MRIAVLFEYPTLNGGERSMLAIMERLGKEAFEFIAIAPAKGPLAEELSQLGISMVPRNSCDQDGNRLSRAQLEQDLCEIVNQISPDLLHANSLSMGRLTGKIATDLDIPCSAHLRDIIKLKKSVINDLNGNQKLVAVSNATRDFHVSQGLDPDRTEVIYNGVNCDLFKPGKRTGELYRILNIPDDAFTTMTIGQIGLRKGQDVLSEAVIHACKHVPNLHVIIVGERHSQKDESIQFEKNIGEVFEQNQLGNRLHMMGYRNDVHEILNEIDLVIHPAHQEPLGRVLLEAGASGKPIIATDVGGTIEILDDRVSGRLIPPKDPELLTSLIIELANDPEQRKSLGEEARKKICSGFSIATASDNLARFFNQF